MIVYLLIFGKCYVFHKAAFRNSHSILCFAGVFLMIKTGIDNVDKSGIESFSGIIIVRYLIRTDGNHIILGSFGKWWNIWSSSS